MKTTVTITMIKNITKYMTNNSPAIGSILDSGYGSAVKGKSLAIVKNMISVKTVDIINCTMSMMTATTMVMTTIPMYLESAFLAVFLRDTGSFL
jgi:hypothetical protein